MNKGGKIACFWWGSRSGQGNGTQPPTLVAGGRCRGDGMQKPSCVSAQGLWGLTHELTSELDLKGCDFCSQQRRSQPFQAAGTAHKGPEWWESRESGEGVRLES